MTNKVPFLLLASAFVAAMIAGCKDPNPQPEPEPDPSEYEALVLSVPVTDDNWVFDARPVIYIHAENPNDVALTAECKMRISTDKGKTLLTVEKSVKIPANGSEDIMMTTEEDLEPGFYKAACFANNRSARIFTFGVNPTAIVSAPDMQADFNSFWDATISQLEAVDMDAQLFELPKASSAARKAYMVEMKSLPDGLNGEPVTIHGYYLEPQDGKKHPVVIHYYGYDDLKPSGVLYCPSGGSSQEYAEFYLSTRGQVINNRTAAQRGDGLEMDFHNDYGDWFAFNFGQRDAYYYRGAFMDCVQAIRFMATRQTSDMSNLFAEGKSQGGAFSYAAAALSPYPLSAVAPGVAFLGDFPDYFQIVDWPKNVALSNQGSMSDAEMYAFLSYFDTKNLATRITCPVIANVCLQDVTCPPHTNIAPFNNLSNPDKEVYFYPTLGHEIPSGWDNKYMAFFKARIKQ